MRTRGPSPGGSAAGGGWLAGSRAWRGRGTKGAGKPRRTRRKAGPRCTALLLFAGGVADPHARSMRSTARVMVAMATVVPDPARARPAATFDGHALTSRYLATGLAARPAGDICPD